MNLSKPKNFSHLADTFGADSQRRRDALRLVVRAWGPEGMHAYAGYFGSRPATARALRRRAVEIYRDDRRGDDDDPKGFVIVGLTLGYLALIVLGAALTWAIEKFLDWWWDHRHEPLPSWVFDEF